MGVVDESDGWLTLSMMALMREPPATVEVRVDGSPPVRPTRARGADGSLHVTIRATGPEERSSPHLLEIAWSGPDGRVQKWSTRMT